MFYWVLNTGLQALRKKIVSEVTPQILCKLRKLQHFHNILRLFDALTNFRFTTSETMRDYYL